MTSNFEIDSVKDISWMELSRDINHIRTLTMHVNCNMFKDKFNSHLRRKANKLLFSVEKCVEDLSNDLDIAVFRSYGNQDIYIPREPDIGEEQIRVTELMYKTDIEFYSILEADEKNKSKKRLRDQTSFDKDEYNKILGYIKLTKKVIKLVEEETYILELSIHLKESVKKLKNEMGVFETFFSSLD